MPPRRHALDDTLAEIGALRDEPDTPAARHKLQRALSHANSYVVAAAASLVGDARLVELFPLLEPAFERFVQRGAEVDKGCRAKAAIASALYNNEVDAADLYLIGVRYVQPEPVWGGSVDTAATLRGTCGLGLAMLNHPDAMDILAGLLADTEPVARAHAAVALGNSGRAEAIPLLRFKCLTGDERPDVLGEAMSSLVSLRPTTGVPFVASFLDNRVDTTAESAAIALGQSRREEVLPILSAFVARARTPLMRTALLSLGLLRSPGANDVLLRTIAEAGPAVAAHAIAALAIQRFDEALVTRVKAVVERRAKPAITEAFREHFGE